MTKKLLLFGGVGIGTAIAMTIIDVYRNGTQDYEFVGFINDNKKTIDGFPVLGAGPTYPG